MYTAAAHENGPSPGVLHWAGTCKPSCKTKSLIRPCWRHQRGIVSCVWFCCFCFAFCANALLDHLMSNKKILGNTTMSITSSDSVHLCNSEMALKSGVVHWHGAGLMWHTTPMSAPAPLHCLGAITLLLKVPQNTKRWPESDGELRGYNSWQHQSHLSSKNQLLSLEELMLWFWPLEQKCGPRSIRCSIYQTWQQAALHRNPDGLQVTLGGMHLLCLASIG